MTIATSCCARLYELPITRLVLGDSFHPGGRALTRKLGELALVNRSSRVLDVASGIGNSARVLATARGCDVVGVDASAASVDAATQLSGAMALGQRVRFLVGDAAALPFEDDSFDVVVCECALCILSPMAGVLAEMRRVLVPGGRLAVSDVVLSRPIPAELDNLLGRVLCLAGARSTDGYRDAMVDSGFENVRCRDVSHVLLELCDQIEARLARLGALARAVRLPVELGDAAPVLRAGRAFVSSGGAGYALVTARA